MSATYITTIATTEQIASTIKDGFLKGHSQKRVAVVGRSNVGKSTLINSIVGEKVARTSQTPGKTRAIHFFLWEGQDVIVVDLPGYGFAQVSKSEQRRWGEFIDAYLRSDEKLSAILILIDARHGPTGTDREAIEFFLDIGKPIVFVMTKTDAIKNQKQKSASTKNMKAFITELESRSDLNSKTLWVSSKNNENIPHLKKIIKEY